MAYSSPFTGTTLKQFAGTPATIANTADQYKTLGKAMEETARTLRGIADDQISLATDRLKEDAEKLEGDLSKAATRYRMTGAALAPYAEALETAQDWYTRRSDEVTHAEEWYLTAEGAVSTAVHATSQAVETPEEAQAAGDHLVDVQHDLERALESRNRHWRAFDSAFELWEQAFETAADGVADAMDAADNDDGHWEWITNALAVIGAVIIVIAVVALFVVSNPWSTILLAATLALSALHLTGTVYLYMNGKASLSDVLWSVFGLATAGVGALAGRAIKLATMANGGGEILAASQLASKLPVFAHGVRMGTMPRLGGFLNPFSVLMRGPQWASLNRWAPQLVNWASKGPRSTTIAAEWGQVIVGATPGITRAGVTAVTSWAAGVAGAVYTLTPWYTPIGRR